MSVAQAAVAKPSNRLAPVRAGASTEIKLTAKQKRLIRESFLKLEPAIDLAGQLFYLKLHRLDPSFLFGSERSTKALQGGTEGRNPPPKKFQREAGETVRLPPNFCTV